MLFAHPPEGAGSIEVFPGGLNDQTNPVFLRRKVFMDLEMLSNLIFHACYSRKVLNRVR